MTGKGRILPGTGADGQYTLRNDPKPGLTPPGALPVYKKKQLCCRAIQLLDLLRQPFRLQFQLRIFGFKLLHPFRRQFIQHAGFLLGKLAQFVIRTGTQLIQRFRDRRDFFLQRLVQPPQLREFLLVAKIQVRPALPQDEAVRVFRDFAQQFDVAGVLRLIDGGGQLVIRLQLVRLSSKIVYG